MDDSRKDIHTAGVPRICQACEARHKGICGGMEPEQLLELSRSTKIRTVPVGTELLIEGETSGTFSNILSGVVKLSKLMADGRHQIVGLQFAPDFVGRPFSDESLVAAEAATDVTICTFPRDALEDMTSRSPGLGKMLLSQSLAELDEARDWMLTLGQRTAEERVAHFLHTIAAHIDPYRKDDDESTVDIELPLSRADIADFLGLTIETVSRQFTRLRNQGVIEKLDGRNIRIPSLDALREIAER
ncbi:MAG: Crp/Fnr family transcriptional regulator [Rhodospirillales bacterium]